jgi:hypothetical protein
MATSRGQPPVHSRGQAASTKQLGWIVLASIVGVLAIGIGGVLLLRARSEQSADAAADSAPALAPSRPSPATTGADSSATAPSRSASPTGAAIGVPQDVNACMRELFPSETFQSRPPKFDFVCTETSPWKGSANVRGEIVRGGSGQQRVTDAMREWAVMGWFDMAAFATVRARCCPSAPPLVTPVVSTCTPLHEVLANLGARATSGAAPDDPKVVEAIDGYTAAVRCVLHAGASNRFGDYQPLQGGEEAAYKKTLARVFASLKK